MDLTYPSTYSVEFEIVSLSPATGNAGEGVVEGISTINEEGADRFYVYNIDDWSGRSTINTRLGAGTVLKYEYDGTSVKVYRGGSLVNTKSKNSNYPGFRLKAYRGRSIALKNIKVKLL